MEHHTAGDPINGLKWTRKTTLKISGELRKAGISVCPKTVGRLLKGLKFSLRVNHKKVAGSSSPFRNQQFEYINRTRKRCERQGWPTISIDTKKRELVGRFKNAGATWESTPVLVKDHDFRSDAKGIAIPWGLYDTQANRGRIFVGTSHDTPAFSVTALAQWWTDTGRRRYSQSKRLLILADCGGSNGSRTRAWKYELQTRLCDRFGLTLTVCHYPPRAPPNGTRSNIACSVRSAKTGLANRSRATRPYSTFFAPQRPRPGSSSMQLCSTVTTLSASKYRRHRWTA